MITFQLLALFNEQFYIVSGFADAPCIYVYIYRSRERATEPLYEAFSFVTVASSTTKMI